MFVGEGEQQMRHPIRRAAPADRPAVEDLVQAAYEPWVPIVGGRPAPMDADYPSLIAAGRVFLTGPDRVDIPDGLIVLVPENGVLLVENVAVRPRLHGQGIGRRLLAFAEDEARRLGRPAVRLYTHARMTRNRALYEALGYVRTGIQPVGDSHIVLFRKELSQSQAWTAGVRQIPPGRSSVPAGPYR